jgi:hypothetical protein
MTLEEIIDRLGARRSGKAWMARCPAHEDSTPSLSIDEKDGKILLFDHGGGCSLQSICDAMGIGVRDLFTNGTSSADVPPGPKRIVETYDYLDEQRQLLFQTVRYFPKDFRQRRPDGRGGWIWNMDGVRRVLYNLPEVIAANSVLVVEGEKDVETARELRIVATCNPIGAGKWLAEYAEFLADKNITVIPDNDGAAKNFTGEKHAETICSSLHGKVKSLALCKLPGGIKDLSEYIANGFSKQSLLELIKQAPAWSEGASAPQADFIGGSAVPDFIPWPDPPAPDAQRQMLFAALLAR